MDIIIVVSSKLSATINVFHPSTEHWRFGLFFSTRRDSMIYETGCVKISPAFDATSHVRMQVTVEEKHGRAFVNGDE